MCTVLRDARECGEETRASQTHGEMWSTSAGLDGGFAKNVVKHSVGSRLDDVCRAAMADEEASFGEYIVALHAYCRIAI